MSASRAPILLLCALALTGCEKIKSMGGTDPKELDAQAIGYACRVSQKTPEACMKENDTHSPTHVLDGWKTADRDIKDKVIDISMGVKNAPASAVPPAPPMPHNEEQAH